MEIDRKMLFGCLRNLCEHKEGEIRVVREEGEDAAWLHFKLLCDAELAKAERWGNVWVEYRPTLQGYMFLEEEGQTGELTMWETLKERMMQR